MERWRDGEMERWTDRQRDRQAGRWLAGRQIDRKAGRWWTDGSTDGQTEERHTHTVYLLMGLNLQTDKWRNK